MPTARRWSGSVRAPPAELAAGLGHHVPAEHLDRAAVLRHRDEVGRRDRAELGVLPAQQRLDAADHAGAEVDDRLVDDGELLEHRLGDLLAEEDLLGGGVALGAVDHHDAALVAGLGLVERDVGVREQRVRRLDVAGGREDHADAGPHEEPAAADLDRLRRSARRAVRRSRRTDAGVPDSSSANSSPPSRATVSLARTVGDQAGADHLQHGVARGVPVPVVDHLEVVEVHQQQREPGAVVVGQRRVEPLHEQRAVREPGERVVVGLVGQPVGELVAVADVVQGQHRALERAPVELADGGDLEPAPAAVRATQPALDEAVAALALEHRPDRVEGAALVLGVHLRLQVGGVREPLPVAQRGVRGGADVADAAVDADDDHDVGEVGHQVLPPLVAVQQLRRTTLHGRAQVAGQPQWSATTRSCRTADGQGQGAGQPEVAGPGARPRTGVVR